MSNTTVEDIAYFNKLIERHNEDGRAVVQQRNLMALAALSAGGYPTDGISANCIENVVINADTNAAVVYLKFDVNDVTRVLINADGKVVRLH